MRTPKDNIADREFLTVDPDLAIAAGAWEGVTKVNKFGYAPDGAQTAGADIWDRADAVPTQSTWQNTLTARLYNIVSDDADDATGGIGAETLRLWGLTSWDSKETFEDIIMDGTTPVSTVDTYVCIHRMSIIEYGATGPNHGTITATSSVGGVVIAQINPLWGQTEMAIYGIPSTQTAYLTNWYASVQKGSGTSVDVNFRLLYSQDPENTPSQFVTKEIRGLQSTGSSNGMWRHFPYKKFTGPGIIKISAYSSAADVDVTAGFDLILLDN